jgi:soluble cytochrome b562
VPRVSLLCSLVTALLLTACGGGGGEGGGDALSKQEYQDRLNTTRTELSTSFDALGTQLEGALKGSGSLDDAASEVESIQEKLRAQADELENTTPPDDAAAANDKLASGMQELADDLDAFKSALESGDFGKIQTEANKIETFASGKTLQQAGDDLEAAGYKFSE